MPLQRHRSGRSQQAHVEHNFLLEEDTYLAEVNVTQVSSTQHGMGIKGPIDRTPLPVLLDYLG